MSDIIEEIEKAIEKFTNKAVDRSDMDDEGYIRDRFQAQATAFKSGCDFILPLLKKCIEQRDANMHWCPGYNMSDVCNKEILKLLGKS